MGLFDLFGGAVSGGLGLLGQYLTVGYQKELQEHAGAVNYKYAEKTARNQPTWNRAGLESAGYNPMLAVQNATSGATAGWTSTGQANPVDLSGDVSTGIANAQSFQRLKNETDTAKSQVEANEATAERQRAEASNAREQNPYISKRQEAEIGQIGAQTSKLQSDTEYNHALMDNLKQRLALDQYLGELGFATQRRGQDLNYNASTYASNVSKYGYDVNAETQRGMRTDKFPFGFGSTYYDMRGLDPRMRSSLDIDDRKYWRNYY